MTPLSDFLRRATAAERDRCAALAGTSVGYLYQLAGCHRRNPSVALAVRLAEATEILHRESEGRLPAITAEQIASMCAIADFENVPGDGEGRAG